MNVYASRQNEVRREIEAALIDLARSRRATLLSVDARRERELAHSDLAIAYATIERNEYEIEDAIDAASLALVEIREATRTERREAIEADRYLSAANDVAISYSNFVREIEDSTNLSLDETRDALARSFLDALDELDALDALDERLATLVEPNIVVAGVDID